MIRHIVMTNFKAEVGQRERDEFSRNLKNTLAKVPGTHNVIVARATDIEGKVRYDAALFIDFDDEVSLKSYLEHPTHQAAQAQMLPLFEKFLVSDYVY